MIDDSRSRMPFNDAFEQVGRAIYGDDWISSLTERRKWLVERYVDGRSQSGALASNMPGQTTYDVAGCKWAEYPGSPALLAEATSARDRRDWKKTQDERALEWLEDHDFDVDAASFNPEELSRELERAALDERPRPGKTPVITNEAKAWLVSLACRKAKELGYPHEV